MEGLCYIRRPPSPFIFEAPVRLGDVQVKPGVRILSHTYINSGRVESEVYIGRFCSIGENVTIGTGHHDMSLLSTSSFFASDAGSSVKGVDGNPRVRVQVGHDVWIGSNSTIMNGVKVGHGAVIGAGAVVTKDVPAYAVVAGVPAKILKYRFTDEVINRLVRSRWWEFDQDILKTHRLKGIEDSLLFIESLGDEHRTMAKEKLTRI